MLLVRKLTCSFMIKVEMNEATRQQQFLNVLERDEAERRFRAVLDLSPLEAEAVALAEAWGRVLAEDIAAAGGGPGVGRGNRGRLGRGAARPVWGGRGIPR